MTNPDEWTVAEDRQWLIAHIEEGVNCHVCGQFNKAQPRSLNDRIARDLFAMWHKNGTDWVHVPSLGRPVNSEVAKSKSGEFAFAKHWGLIEKMVGEGSRGMWRLTSFGEHFLRNRVRVPKYKIVYQNHAYEHDGNTETVSIADILDTPYDEEELFATVQSTSD